MNHGTTEESAPGAKANKIIGLSSKFGAENGGRLTKVVEPEALTILREYVILWKRQEVDLARLAKLRWVEKLSLGAIASKLGIGKSTVRDRLKRIREA